MNDENHSVDAKDSGGFSVSSETPPETKTDNNNDIDDFAQDIVEKLVKESDTYKTKYGTDAFPETEKRFYLAKKILLFLGIFYIALSIALITLSALEIDTRIAEKVWSYVGPFMTSLVSSIVGYYFGKIEYLKDDK
jgi:multidrug transporter EmrE-like cation transporter